VMVLADYAIKVENHYSSKAGFYKPMDMEWAKDGIDGHLYMVQARPETVASQKKGSVLQIYHLKQRSPVLLKGKAVGTRIGAGKARIVND
ncbi:phosphoenolpyruvate synthase, partial [Salmonella enterica subsp. enterica serovar Oranienburg]